MSLGALGVVYGDIGTSPLYALRECFGAEHGLPLNPENIIGILSLIFWTLVLIINVKYMAYIMRADNRGEGGILSLMALAITGMSEGKRKASLIMMGLFGAALLFGDGIITPAISVLSAVEGLTVVTPVFSAYVVPLTLFILSILFAVQFFGTGKIGKIFGPVILVWFFVLAVLGIKEIAANLDVLRALNPTYALDFFINNGKTGFLVLGSVFLVVTGGEALYADMGHFGRRPIRLAWFFVAMPALTLNYFGQGALLLRNPTAISNPFFLMAPSWALWPLVFLATAAAVIASQALISGVYSITKQAVQLGFSPRLSIVHTSSREIGQIYIPFVNWSMLIGVLWLVSTFKTSSNIASAYGIAVTGTMVITTILAIVVAKVLWKWSSLKIVLIFGTFLVVDLAFFSTNIIKIAHGGWIPLVIGIAIYLLMSTWKKGRQILGERLKQRSMPMAEFFEGLKANPPLRISGSAIYLSSDAWGIPVPLLHNLKHNKVLHEQVALLTFKTMEVPFTQKNERVVIQPLTDGFYRIVAKYGFMETPKMKHILEACRENGIKFSISETTFVLGRETILPKGDVRLSVWRERIFAFMARNAERPTVFFRIPPNQVIEVGIQVEI